mgnify:CR=1 FL=1
MHHFTSLAHKFEYGIEIYERKWTLLFINGKDRLELCSTFHLLNLTMLINVIEEMRKNEFFIFPHEKNMSGQTSPIDVHNVEQCWGKMKENRLFIFSCGELCLGFILHHLPIEAHHIEPRRQNKKKNGLFFLPHGEICPLPTKGCVIMLKNAWNK